MATSDSEKSAKQDDRPLFSLSHTMTNQFGFFGSSSAEKIGLPPPPPCAQVHPTEASSAATVKYTLESVVVDEALTLLKGRVSTQEVFALSNSDLVPGIYEGGLKLWEGSIDLVKTLQSEVKDGLLDITGKRVLELGCGHGLPGIFTCLKGADVVDFQDFNAEVLRCLTIPNVNANLKREPQQTSVVEKNTSSKVRFFAGDWSEIHPLLSHPWDSECEKDSNSTSERELDTGYDIILMAETVYSITSLKSLYDLTKKCLSCPHGVVYVAGKKHYFGVGGGTRQFLAMVEKDGVLVASLIAEVTDGSSNVREVWKFSFK